MSTIEAKLDAMISKMNNRQRISNAANAVGIEKGREKKSIIDEGLAHEGPYQVEEAQFVNGNRSYNFKPNNNLPTHYTPALGNHKNFSYGSGVQHSPRLVQNFHEPYAPQVF